MPMMMMKRTLKRVMTKTARRKRGEPEPVVQKVEEGKKEARGEAQSAIDMVKEARQEAKSVAEMMKGKAGEATKPPTNTAY